jgi:hypothetical protein
MIEFELKKIKYFDAGSEETPCFTAQIWEKGKHVADAKNSGHGGGNEIYVNKMDDKYQRQVLHDKYDNMDIEAEIFGRVWEDYDIKRLQGKGLVLKKDDKISGHVKFPIAISKWKKHPQYASWNQREIDKYTAQGYQVMNTNL